MAFPVELHFYISYSFHESQGGKMNIFLLFLSMFFMIGYYLISSPSQNIGYNEVQYENQNSEMRSLIDCVVAQQNAFINNASFNDECVKRYKITSTEVCTNEKFEPVNCSVDPYYDFIITTSYKINQSQYKDAFRIIDKTRQDFGTLGLFIHPNIIAANSIGKKLIPESVIKDAELESGQIAYVIQNSVQTFDPTHPDPDDDSECRFSIFGKICDDVDIEVCTGNEVWDEDQKKCVDQTGLCETGKILLIDESDNSYYCVDPTSKICTGNETLQYNHKLQVWECIEVENSDDTECDLSQFSLRLHSSLDSVAPTARIKTINCNSCEKRVLDEDTCTIYCSPDASKLTLGECYNDKLVSLENCKGEKRGVYFGFAPGRTQYAVNANITEEAFQNSDIILNVEKFLDKEHLQDRLFHCFECATGMNDRLSFYPFSAMCKTEGDDDDDENIVCAYDEIIAMDQKTGKFYCEKIPEEPEDPEEPDDPDDDDEPHTHGIALSSYSGATTYPTSATFYVTENSSNGEITVQTSNPKIATASISGSIVTVKPVAKGKVSVYVRSATRGSYDVSVATYTLQINGANIVVNASDLILEYNGKEQSCANVRVKTPASGATVTYSLAENGTYGSAPVLTDAASIPVYYKVSASNYIDLAGSYQCTLTGGQEGGVILSETSGTITYPTTSTSFTASCLNGKEFSITNSNTDVASAKIEKDAVVLTYNKKSGTTVITVTCPEADGYLSASATYTLTVKKGKIEVSAPNKTLTYSGSAQSCANVSVKSPAGADVTYSTSSGGSYSSTAPTLTDTGDIDVYYKVTADNYEDKTGSYKCTMSKGGNSSITLSEYSGTITYPETSTSFTATCNSGGDLTVKTDDKSIATAVIHNSTVTVTYESAGETTIHVMCDKTSNYDESEATYNIVTQKGTLKPAVDDKYLTYSGSAQSCANTFKIEDVSSFAVKYSSTSNGTYSSTAPSLTDTGSIDVFYKITAEDYEDFYGNYKCTMGTGGNSLELESYSGNTVFPNNKTIAVTKNISNGTLSAKSSKTSVANVVVNNNKVIITPVATGSATITVTSEATSNYSAASVNYQLTVKEGTINATISNPSKTFDTKPLSCNGVSNVTPTGATVKYKTSKEGSYSTTVPTVTNVSDSKTIYYQISATNYETKEGVFSCSITSGGESVITFSENSGVMVYPTTTRKFTATCSSGGTLSAASANTNIATASISGGTVTVTYKSAGETNIIVTCAATDNYGQSSKAYKITNQLGTITADVNDVAKVYDGTPLSCDGVTNIKPTNAVVEYKKPNENYSTTVPTITNVEDSITISYKITATNYTSKTGTFSCSVTKNATGGKLTITPTSGTITYPTTTTTFTANCTTGGTLSATSSNTNVATVSMNGSTGTVTYKSAGTATITVKCAATSNYGELTGTYSITTQKGTITASASDITLTYNGTLQSCANVSVTNPSIGYTVSYSLVNGGYNKNTIELNAVNTKTIYYQVSADNYNDFTGSYTCKMVQSSGNSLNLSSANGSINYPDTKTFTVTSNTSGGSLSVSSSNTSVATATISGTTVTVTPHATGTAVITVTSAATTNYRATSATYTITVNPGTISASAGTKNLSYSGSAQSCDNVKVTSPDGTSVTYSETQNGTYSTTAPTLTAAGASKTIYYKVNKTYYTEASGNYTCKMSDAGTAVITLSESSGTITYPTTTRTFTATCNSGGALTVGSSNPSVATASINNGTVTVNVQSTGTATITVYCAANGSYGSTSATFALQVKPGTISATAGNKSLTYSGSAQSCDNVTVTSPDGTSVTYSTTENGTYSPKAPTLTSGDSSTAVYYKVSKTNYITVSGHYNCTMSSAGSTTTLSSTSGTLYPYDSTDIEVTCSNNGAVTAASSNTDVATVSYKSNTVTIKYVNAGTATITAYCGANNGIAGSSATYSLTNALGTIEVEGAEDKTLSWDMKLMCTSITVINPKEGAVVTYGEKRGAYSKAYKVTNLGGTTVFYQIEADNFETLTGQYNCTVEKGTIRVSASDKELTYTGRPQSCANVTVSQPASGATVQYSTDKVTYSDSVYLTNAGDSKPIYYRVMAAYYNEASGQYTCSVKDNSSTTGCAEPTADCCLKNGGSFDDTVESAPKCQILSSAGGTCPSGFTKVTYKTDKQTAYYCEQAIVVK